MSTQKNKATERLRHLILGGSDIVETAYADCGLTTLSFQSTISPNRHVWVDSDLAGQKVVDIEDWLDDRKWDNSVGHFTSAQSEIIARIAVAWLAG